MDYQNQETEYRSNHGKGLFAGVVIGGLVGAITGLLLAPQSGKETRDQIEGKVTEVRDRAGETLDHTVAQVRTRAGQLKSDLGSKARELKSQSEDVLVDQLDRLAAAAEARKKDIQSRR
jgi:gas vesicle protein